MPQNKIKNILSFVILLPSILFISCSKFNVGDCVIAKDGYIWKINDIKESKYSVSGYSVNGWGNDVKLEYDIIDKTHLKTNCPVIRQK